MSNPLSLTQCNLSLTYFDKLIIFNSIKMKHRLYNIKNIIRTVLPSETHQNQGSDIREIPEPSRAKGDNPLQEMMSMFKSFFDQHSRRQSSNLSKKRDFELQARDREVLIDLPFISNDSISSSELKQWISKVVKTICSTAFNYFSKGQLNYEQTKVYCSENIFKNIVHLSQQYHLSDDEIEIIDSHIKKGVLNYLSMKYPLTESTQVNRKLQEVVREVDNIESLQNNYFTNSDIVFEYRQDGNYNDLIMMVINDLMARVDEKVNGDMTNFQQFEKFMSGIFEKVEDESWMKLQQIQKINKELGIVQTEKQISLKSENFLKENEKNENIEEIQNKIIKKNEVEEKYKAKVKQYTHYAIGRKISQNTPHFTPAEIQNGSITIKSPQVLRLITKWCEQLQEKYSESYFSSRSESVKVQRGNRVNSLLTWMRKQIDEKLKIQKKLIKESTAQLFKNNYQLQSHLLKNQLGRNGDEHLDMLEKVSGKFAYKVVKNLHSNIIVYLNMLIHGLLKEAKDFHDRNNFMYSIWPSPPNLISFKVGDLMRCKCSSQEKQILMIYEQIHRISRENPEKLKIIRIKNRLKSGTNDILMNVRFSNKIICEIQLAIDSKSSNFIKCSNMFRHYLYELQRSLFGPITELSSIWNSLDPRSNIYEELVEQQQYSKGTDQKEHLCKTLGSSFQFLPYTRSFICSRCEHTYCHNRFLKNHIKCNKCSYIICAKCRIEEQTRQSLSKTFGQGQKLSQSCGKRIEKSDQLPRNGLCVLIEAKRLNFQCFSLITYLGIDYLLGKKGDQIYQIASLKTSKDKQRFRSNYLIYTMQSNPLYEPINDKLARTKYILPLVMKENFKKEKETISLMGESLNTQECKQILSIGTPGQKQCVKNIFLTNNLLSSLPFAPEEFSKVEWLTLSQNAIKSIENLDKLRLLNHIIMSSCNLAKFPSQLYQCRNIQKLTFNKNFIKSIDDRMSNFQELLTIQFGNNKLTQIPEGLFECKKIKMIKFQTNQIINISDSIANLVDLESIFLSSNKLKKLPQNIGQLHNLKEIYLFNNRELAQLPSTFAQLKNIQHFDISNTLISEIPLPQQGWVNLKVFKIQNTKILALPQRIGRSTKIQVYCFSQIQGFSHKSTPFNQIRHLQLTKGGSNELLQLLLKMNNLKVMSLQGTNFSNLKQFPSGPEILEKLIITSSKITQFPNLYKCCNLKSLKIASNKITELPTGFFEGLTALQQLNCESNVLTIFPISFTKLSKLSKLISNSNKLSTFIEGLKIQNLDQCHCFWPDLSLVQLNYNCLQDIPIEICACKSLKILCMQNNGLKRIRPQIKNLIKLSQFYANTNSIQLIPSELLCCTQLTIFAIRSNKVACIPKFLQFLPNIKKINISPTPKIIECFDWIVNSTNIDFGDLKNGVKRMLKEMIQSVNKVKQQELKRTLSLQKQEEVQPQREEQSKNPDSEMT